MLRHRHHGGLFQKRKAEQLHEFAQVASIDLSFGICQSLDQILDLLDAQQMRNGAGRIGRWHVRSSYLRREKAGLPYITNAKNVSSSLIASSRKIFTDGFAQHLDW
jgi:hypothetical protein